MAAIPKNAERSDNPDDLVLSVSEFTAALKDVVEGTFPSVWVAGEISDLRVQQSGHCYFSLKDEGASLPAVVWRATRTRIRFALRNGLEVVCRGGVEIYAPHGKYQLIVREMQPRGEGALELAFRQLHQKLAAEGLFDPVRKRPLPAFPRRIAFVTSPTGAAIRDFLEMVRRQWRGMHVYVVPARVQGEGAAAEIAAAIGLVNRWRVPPDVLVVGRGGGSREDLWAFNEEVVVRAIFASQVPVVSAVGHEIDVTLSDLVADVRALTPTDAAVRVVPAAEEIQRGLRTAAQRLAFALRKQAIAGARHLDMLARRGPFARPLERLHDAAQQLDALATRAERAIRRRRSDCSRHVDSAAARLESLSPLSVLARGYSLTRTADGRVVSDASRLAPGERITTRVARGSLVSRVEETHESA